MNYYEYYIVGTPPPAGFGECYFRVDKNDAHKYQYYDTKKRIWRSSLMHPENSMFLCRKITEEEMFLELL